MLQIMNVFRGALRVLLALAALTGLARADQFAAALAPLAKDSFAETAGLVERLAELGDPRGVPLLRALGDGDLILRKSDGRPVIRRAAGAIDALTGAATTLAPGDGDPFRVNNRCGA